MRTSGCITFIPVSSSPSIKSDIDGTAETLAQVCSLELDQKETCFWMMVYHALLHLQYYIYIYIYIYVVNDGVS